MPSDNLTLHPTLKPRQITDSQLKFYKEEGYLLLPGLIPQEDALALRQEVAEIIWVTSPPKAKMRQTSQYLAGSRLDSLINSPRLLDLAGQLLEGPTMRFLPFTAVKGPGGGEFHFHQDNQYRRFDGPGINMWFSLDHITEEKGCLRLVPRSHLLGDVDWTGTDDGTNDRKIPWEPAEFINMCLQPGDCLAFSRLLIHGSGPNKTAEHRIGYAIQFHRDDVSFWDDGSWKLLKDFSRWSTMPTRELHDIAELPPGGHR